MMEKNMNNLSELSNTQLEERDAFIMSLPYEGGIWYAEEFLKIHMEFERRNFYPKRMSQGKNLSGLDTDE